MGKELSLAIQRKNEIQATQDLNIANALHKEIYNTSKYIILKAVEAGKVLLRIKASLGHGHFQPWFDKADTEISLRTAVNYMTLAKGWDEIQEQHGSLAYCMSVDAALKCISGLHKPEKSNGATPKSASQIGKASADLVPCPHGGEHEYDEEACVKCHDPKPPQAQAHRAAEADVSGQAVAAEAGAGVGLMDAGEGGAEAEAERVAVGQFAEAEKLLVQANRLMTKLSVSHPSRYQQSAQDSVDVAYQDLKRWKREVL
jgi:hypothetical protein